jgi:hypothetical protein
LNPSPLHIADFRDGDNKREDDERGRSSRYAEGISAANPRRGPPPAPNNSSAAAGAAGVTQKIFNEVAMTNYCDIVTNPMTTVCPQQPFSIYRRCSCHSKRQQGPR